MIRINASRNPKPVGCSCSLLYTLFALNLAHHLDTLLRIMAVRVQLIRTRTPMRVSDTIAGDFAELDATIDSAFAISRELMALGRPQTAGASIIDANEVFSDAQAAIQGMLGRGIELFLRLRGAEPFVQAEAFELEWMLFNLVANARDAMPDGGVLTIETADGSLALADVTRDSRKYLRLTVTDTGPGVSPKMVDTMFEPFATTRSNRVGFGLTSVAITVRTLTGRLSVDSDPAVGTRVHVYLPTVSGTRDRAVEK